MFIILYAVCSLLSVYVNSSQYDQRQTGDLNVQFDVKDVQIFALLKGDKEEYVDYDYAYDYSELTIKPQNRTTPKPFNGTSSTTEQNGARDNSTIGTTMLQEYTIAPIDNEMTTEYITTTNGPTVNEYNKTMKNISNVPTEQTQTDKYVTNNVPKRSSSRRNCRKGYVLNEKGECQLKLNTNGNALLKLVKLSQKLKLRRKNKSNDNS